jgi:hypothetical protein
MGVSVRAFRLVHSALSDRREKPNRQRGVSGREGLISGPSRARSIDRERQVEIAEPTSKARWAKRPKS